MLELSAHGVYKSYDGIHKVFSPLSLTVKGGEVLVVTGSNGAGKSTLLQMLAGVMSTSGGTIKIDVTETSKSVRKTSGHKGFVAPYLQLYEEFTAWEHCELDARIRGVSFDASYTGQLFEFFGLSSRRNDELKTFSSGMKQRVKLMLATWHRPELLLLDEPTSNFDESGIEKLYEHVRREQQRGAAIIIATNDARDLALGTLEVRLGSK